MPHVLPGLVFGLVLATLLARPLARTWGIGIAHAWLLMASLAAVLALTLTPSPYAMDVPVTGGPRCDVSRIGPATLATYLRFDDPMLNVFLFVPLGAAAGWVRQPRLRWAILVAGLALPWLVEGTQYMAVGLGRACQAGDVFDNSLGMLVGFVPALLVAVLAARGGAR